MRRSQTALTPTLCQRTKATSSKQVLWDAKVLGLAIVISPASTRTWIFVARRSGQPIRVRSGEYQEAWSKEATGLVWTVDAAREEAGKFRKLHDQGKDIRAHVQELRNPKDVAELAADYRTSLAFCEMAKRSRQSYGGYLDNHILPALRSPSTRP